MPRPKLISDRKNRKLVERRASEIRRGDVVQVIAGDDKGKVGKVLRVFPKTNRLLVERVNFVKKHTKARRAGQQGGILEKEAPIHVSNVLLFDPKVDRGVRVGVQVAADGSTERISRASGDTLGKA
jgi:large subunit ribosomal protein L24